MLGNSSSSELTQTLEQAVRKGWSLFHWQYLQAGWTPICWEGFRRAVLQDCLSGSLQPHISPFVFPLSNHSAGTDRAVQALEMLCQRPRGRSSTKRKSVQIYYLYSLPKAGRLSVSGTSPVGAAFSPPSAPPKCHCSHYRRHQKEKLARGSVDFGHLQPYRLFFLIFQGHFGNPCTTGWKMFVTVTCHGFMSLPGSQSLKPS